MTRTRRAVATGLLVGLVLAAVGRGVRAAEPNPRININTASAQELARLPGIGPAKAEAILQHRAQHPFAKAEELRDVKGIGEKLYERIKDQVTVGDAPPPPKGRGG
jgi:competence ComEA-like helix-hairpin-helix protein